MFYKTALFNDDYSVLDTDDWSTDVITEDDLHHYTHDLGLYFSSDRGVITSVSQKLKALRLADIEVNSFRGTIVRLILHSNYLNIHLPDIGGTFSYNMLLSGICICTVDDRFSVLDRYPDFRKAEGSLVYLDISGYTNLGFKREALLVYSRCSDVVIINADIPEYADYLASVLPLGVLPKLGIDRFNSINPAIKDKTLCAFEGVVDRVSKDALNSMYINQAGISQDVLLLLLKGDYNAIAKTEPLLYRNADSIIRFCNLLVSSDYLSDELNARLRVTFSRIRSAVNRTRI